MTDSLLFRERAVGAQNAFCRIVFSQISFELRVSLEVSLRRVYSKLRILFASFCWSFASTK
jgi:hypothetical protein